MHQQSGWLQSELPRKAELFDKIYFGCEAGVHDAQTIAEFENEDEDWRYVSEAERSNARVVRLLFKRCGSADGEEPLHIHRFAALRLRLEDDGDAAGVDPGGDRGDVEACELGSVKVFGGGPDRRYGSIVADVFEVLANNEVEVHPASVA